MTITKHGNVLSWASDIDPGTIEQAQKAASLPFVHGHVALMPDAHIGIGSTVGSVIATKGAVIPSAIGVDIGCVDAETEYLSPNGWRRIDEYDGGQVMQYHPGTGRADFVQPLNYIRRTQDTFLRFKTKYGVDQMLTPDHRVLCWKVTGRDRRHVQQVITAQEFADEHARLKIGYNAVFETTFMPVLTTALPLDDAQLRVQVMVMADAHLARGRTAVLHLRKQRKIERARKLLDDADIAFTEHVETDGTTRMRFPAPVASKTYVGMWTASSHQLHVITEECLHWDGNEADRVFFTRSKACADFMHYAFAATGFRSVMRDDVGNDGGTDYRVFANGNTRVSMRGTPKSEITEVPAFDGTAYCFTVPSGFLVLRRGGNIVVTGNCGMAAVPLGLPASALPDNLNLIHAAIAKAVPAGVGKGHEYNDAPTWPRRLLVEAPALSADDYKRAVQQMGTLGSGNHFVEVCLDENDDVWVVLHSGSRGIGNILAKRHIEAAKGVMARYFIDLPDPDLAYLVEGTTEFDEYIEAMLWAQDYARVNRDTMLRAALVALCEEIGFVGRLPGDMLTIIDTMMGSAINCHHNYCEKEHHNGTDVWVTRKGAVRARGFANRPDRGIIPGSMGSATYIVAGKGNPASYNSCSHGAGRRLSRSQARRTLDVDTLREQMAGKAWNDADADKLVDEDPRAYKDIDRVMADQADLVDVLHTLRQVVNYKGL